jgi:hypothetical protein
MNFIRPLFVLIVINFGHAIAQTKQDVFTKTEMVWYGLDFSQAKFVGEFNEIGPIQAMGGVVKVKTGDTTIVTIGGGGSNAQVIRDNYFKAWNNVIINERDKYYLPEYYSKQAVKADLSAVEVLNAKVNPDSMMMTWGAVALTMEKIQEEVNKYDNKGKSGLGLVYIIESFDKILNLATIHVTFFDMATNKVLLVKRLKTQPHGAGLRNYWAASIREAMVESKKHWHKWKKEAGVKK